MKVSLILITVQGFWPNKHDEDRFFFSGLSTLKGKKSKLCSLGDIEHMKICWQPEQKLYGLRKCIVDLHLGLLYVLNHASLSSRKKSLHCFKPFFVFGSSLSSVAVFVAASNKNAEPLVI